MANVLHLFRASKRRLPMQELTEVRAVENSGFEGCAHARPGGRRQVLLVDGETLHEMNLPPGIVRENVTTQGLDVSNLQLGEQLRIGESRLEVSAVCDPCEQLEKVRPGLEREIFGRRGMLCQVLEGGVIRRGDSIEKLPRQSGFRPRTE
ncbi:MAG TPA: MOSC domain-containing protein [Candidatus Dormibacteraeota bacterium]|nr:MOSC domain-containing protein [Candidatus Dormibacteraeota bacterium]